MLLRVLDGGGRVTEFKHGYRYTSTELEAAAAGQLDVTAKAKELRDAVVRSQEASITALIDRGYHLDDLELVTEHGPTDDVTISVRSYVRVKAGAVPRPTPLADLHAKIVEAVSSFIPTPVETRDNLAAELAQSRAAVESMSTELAQGKRACRMLLDNLDGERRASEALRAALALGERGRQSLCDQLTELSGNLRTAEVERAEALSKLDSIRKVLR